MVDSERRPHPTHSPRVEQPSHRMYEWDAITNRSLAARIGRFYAHCCTELGGVYGIDPQKLEELVIGRQNSPARNEHLYKQFVRLRSQFSEGVSATVQNLIDGLPPGSVPPDQQRRLHAAVQEKLKPLLLELQHRSSHLGADGQLVEHTLHELAHEKRAAQQYFSQKILEVIGETLARRKFAEVLGTDDLFFYPSIFIDPAAGNKFALIATPAFSEMQMDQLDELISKGRSEHDQLNALQRGKTAFVTIDSIDSSREIAEFLVADEHSWPFLVWSLAGHAIEYGEAQFQTLWDEVELAAQEHLEVVRRQIEKINTQVRLQLWSLLDAYCGKHPSVVLQLELMPSVQAVAGRSTEITPEVEESVLEKIEFSLAIPGDSEVTFSRQGKVLLAEYGGHYYFVAPVHLPDGAELQLTGPHAKPARTPLTTWFSPRAFQSEELELPLLWEMLESVSLLSPYSTPIEFASCQDRVQSQLEHMRSITSLPTFLKWLTAQQAEFPFDARLGSGAELRQLLATPVTEYLDGENGEWDYVGQPGEDLDQEQKDEEFEAVYQQWRAAALLAAHLSEDEEGSEDTEFEHDVGSVEDDEVPFDVACIQSVGYFFRFFIAPVGAESATERALRKKASRHRRRQTREAMRRFESDAVWTVVRPRREGTDAPNTDADT